MIYICTFVHLTNDVLSGFVEHICKSNWWQLSSRVENVFQNAEEIKFVNQCGGSAVYGIESDTRLEPVQTQLCTRVDNV